MYCNAKAFVELAVIVIIALTIGVASILITKKDDGTIEEVSEMVIEKELGLPNGSVDLTPASKEG